MKKFLIVIAVLIGLTVSVTAKNYRIPRGFKLIENSYGAKMYKNNYGMYAIVVDMDRAKIEFGTLDYYGNDKYNRRSMRSWWNDYSDSNTFAMVNAQFFDMARKTKLAYPLKADGIIKKFYVEKRGSKKSLIITNSGNTYIVNGYNKHYLKSNSVRNMMVGLSPFSPMKATQKIGRTFIGGIPKGSCNPDKATCQYKYLIFFIGKNETQKNFRNKVKYWGVKESSMLMMDGSASSQLYSTSHKLYGRDSKGGQGRPVPHVIKIQENKW